MDLLAGPQRHTLLVGGARSGKTFLLVRAVVARAFQHAGTRHAIIRSRLNAVRNTIGMDTLPKVIASCFPGLTVKPLDNNTRWLLPNGSEIWLLGLDDKERVDKILGFEFATIYFNECSQIPWVNIETALTRLAQNVKGCRQRAYYDLNPTGNRHWTYRLFIEKKTVDGRRKLRTPEHYQWMRINPSDNRDNLTTEFLDELEHGSERRRKRFFTGEYSADLDGALWSIDKIEQNRIEEIDPLAPEGVALIEHLKIARIVVGVDPSGTSGDEDKRSNDIGIVVCGRQAGSKGKGFVLDDVTCNAHPSEWARVVATVVDKWKADCVAAEVNFGGAMVEFTLKSAAPFVRVKAVTASRGKHIRAEPIASIADEGRIQHCGRFDDLEDELCSMSADGYHGERSPNRLDAMVWAFTELFGKSIVSETAKVVVGAKPKFAEEPL